MKPLTDDARHELTFAAAARERRNRPIGLVAGAAALLVIAGITAVVAVADRARAARELKAAAGSRDSVAAQIEELKRLREAAESFEGPAPGEPMSPLDVISKLDQSAIEAGFTEKPPPPRQRTTDKPGIKVKEFTYSNLRSDNLEGMLQWVRSAPDAVPGLEVYMLELKAEPTVWSMTVTFRRWERAA